MSKLRTPMVTWYRRVRRLRLSQARRSGNIVNHDLDRRSIPSWTPTAFGVAAAIAAFMALMLLVGRGVPRVLAPNLRADNPTADRAQGARIVFREAAIGSDSIRVDGVLESAA